MGFHECHCGSRKTSAAVARESQPVQTNLLQPQTMGRSCDLACSAAASTATPSMDAHGYAGRFVCYYHTELMNAVSLPC